MKKDTAKLLEELKGCKDFKNFRKENIENIAKTEVGDYLNNLIEEKGLKKTDIIKRAEMSEVYAYQIMSGIRVPERNKLLCIAFGMGLNFEETQNMLKATGYKPLYAKNPFDCIIIYALCKGLNIIDTNALLFDYGEETLG